MLNGWSFYKTSHLLIYMSGTSNKAVDALSRANLILHEFKVNIWDLMTQGMGIKIMHSFFKYAYENMKI